MPDPIELEIEDPKSVGGGEVVLDPKDKDQNSNKQISAQDLAALQDELNAAKAEAKARRSSEDSAHTRAAQAERTAQESQKRATSEIEQRIDNELGTVDSAIAGANAEIETARNAYKAALSENKWGEAAEANEAMQDAKIRLRDLGYQKQELGRAKERIKAEAARPVPTGVPQRTASWIAAHPKFVQGTAAFDQRYYNAAMAAHFKALEDGVPAESDEYFERIEIATGDKKPKVENKPNKEPEGAATGDAPAGDQKGANITSGRSSDVAGVSRRAAPTNDGRDANGRKVIKLSGDQVEAADSLFGDPTNPLMYIKDPKERYTYWHSQQERLKSEGRLS